MKIEFTKQEMKTLLQASKDFKIAKPLKKINRKKTVLTQKQLKELICYNKYSGDFTWSINAGRNKMGQRADYKSKKGYRRITIDGINYPAHRIAWLYMEGYFPEHEIDHKDRCKYNNRWKNLRHVTRICNARNTDTSSVNTSGVKGVTKCGKKWAVSIGYEGIAINLKTYSDFSTAVRVRWEAEKLLKYPDCETTSTAYLWLKDYEEKQEKIKKLLASYKETS